MRDTTHEWAIGQWLWLCMLTERLSQQHCDHCSLNTIGVWMWQQWTSGCRAEKGYAMDKGYGKIKGETFRVPHMGDMTMDTLD